MIEPPANSLSAQAAAARADSELKVEIDLHVECETDAKFTGRIRITIPNSQPRELTFECVEPMTSKFGLKFIGSDGNPIFNGTKSSREAADLIAGEQRLLSLISTDLYGCFTALIGMRALIGTPLQDQLSRLNPSLKKEGALLQIGRFSAYVFHNKAEIAAITKFFI